MTGGCLRYRSQAEASEKSADAVGGQFGLRVINVFGTNRKCPYVLEKVPKSRRFTAYYPEYESTAGGWCIKIRKSYDNTRHTHPQATEHLTIASGGNVKSGFIQEMARQPENTVILKPIRRRYLPNGQHPPRIQR
jgi:hypothetical protein